MIEFWLIESNVSWSFFGFSLLVFYCSSNPAPKQQSFAWGNWTAKIDQRAISLSATVQQLTSPDCIFISGRANYRRITDWRTGMWRSRPWDNRYEPLLKQVEVVNTKWSNEATVGKRIRGTDPESESEPEGQHTNRGAREQDHWKWKRMIYIGFIQSMGSGILQWRHKKTRLVQTHEKHLTADHVVWPFYSCKQKIFF